jgi:hypothetical protein
VRLFGYAHPGLAKLLPRRGWIEAIELPPGSHAPQYEVRSRSMRWQPASARSKGHQDSAARLPPQHSSMAVEGFTACKPAELC